MHRIPLSRRLFSVPALLLGLFSMPASSHVPLEEKSVLDFTMKDIDGTDVSLSHYRGRVLLLVNVASQCGNTPQYSGLEELYRKYKDRGFEILAFPANNFGAQEPGSDEEIKEFCETEYGVTFDVFSKISVKGGDQHPLYQFLTSKETNPQFAGDVRWNFQKFLVDRQGNVIARFEPKAQPLSDAVMKAVEAALDRQ